LGQRLGEEAVYSQLNKLLLSGGLRPFVESQPEFSWTPHGQKGMLITWAPGAEPAAASNLEQPAPSSASAAASREPSTSAGPPAASPPPGSAAPPPGIASAPATSRQPSSSAQPSAASPPPGPATLAPGSASALHVEEYIAQVCREHKDIYEKAMADAVNTNPSGGDAIMAAPSFENATPSLPHSDTASGSAVPAAGPAQPVDWQAVLGDDRRLRRAIPK